MANFVTFATAHNLFEPGRSECFICRQGVVTVGDWVTRARGSPVKSMRFCVQTLCSILALLPRVTESLFYSDAVLSHQSEVRFRTVRRSRTLLCSVNYSEMRGIGLCCPELSRSSSLNEIRCCDQHESLSLEFLLQEIPRSTLQRPALNVDRSVITLWVVGRFL